MTKLEELKLKAFQRSVQNISKIELNEDSIVEIEIDKLIDNPYQTRIEINENELIELANSIKENELLQPILVRKTSDGFEIIVGHRRVLAHKKLNKKTIKAIVKNIDEKQMRVYVILENLQRSELSIIENSLSFKELLDSNVVSNMSELSIMIGKSVQQISRYLSLLKLPNSIIEKIKTKKYTNVSVLSELNKLDTEEKMVQCLDHIIYRNYNRDEALSYIKSLNNLNNDKKEKDIFKNKKVEIIEDDKKIKIEFKKEEFNEKELIEINNFIFSFKKNKS